MQTGKTVTKTSKTKSPNFQIHTVYNVRQPEGDLVASGTVIRVRSGRH